MRVPFSVGYGQFVMEDSQLRGPMLGASIRGKVDFKMRRVNLGGTYVPLQGLTSGLCEIPLFGPIIVGPKCEGSQRHDVRHPGFDGPAARSSSTRCRCWRRASSATSSR